MAKTSTTVWHLISNRWNSAIAEYALSAARAMHLAGIRSVFTPLASSPAEIRAKKYELSVAPLPQFRLRNLKAFENLAREIKPDLIITYGGPESFLAGFARVNEDGSPRTLWRFRGQDILPNHGGLWQNWKNRISHQHFDRVIAPSEFMGRHYAESKKPISVIPLGCDPQRYYRTPQQGKVRHMEMLLLGRLDPVKGHREFFPVLKQLIQLWQAEGSDLPHPFLHIVGEPANLSTDELYRAGQENGLREGVDFVIEAKRLPKVADLMSRAALGVIPSLGSEVICRTAEEFLLCGTPIAVSGVGSLPETLFSNRAGLNLDGLSTEVKAATLYEWLKLSFRESEEDKQARAREAQEVFSLTQMGKTFQNLIQETIKPRG